MKARTTKKDIVRRSFNIISCGYDELGYLLKYRDADFYTEGVNGWNFDAYFIGNTTICTGYRGMPGRTANFVEDYNRKAREIIESRIDNEAKKDAVSRLLDEFISANEK